MVLGRWADLGAAVGQAPASRHDHAAVQEARRRGRSADRPARRAAARPRPKMAIKLRALLLRPEVGLVWGWCFLGACGRAGPRRFWQFRRGGRPNGWPCGGATGWSVTRRRPAAAAWSATGPDLDQVVGEHPLPAPDPGAVDAVHQGPFLPVVVLEVADPPLRAGAPRDQPPERPAVLVGLAGTAGWPLRGIATRWLWLTGDTAAPVRSAAASWRRVEEAGPMLVELSVVEQRYRAVMEVFSGAPVVDVAARYRVSRKQVHVWLRRCEEGGLGRGRRTAHTARMGIRGGLPRGWRQGCCSCGWSIRGGGRADCGTSASGQGSTPCRPGRRSGGCWSGTAWWPRASEAVPGRLPAVGAAVDVTDRYPDQTNRPLSRPDHRAGPARPAGAPASLRTTDCRAQSSMLRQVQGHADARPIGDDEPVRAPFPSNLPWDPAERARAFPPRTWRIRQCPAGLHHDERLAVERGGLGLREGFRGTPTVPLRRIPCAFERCRFASNALCVGDVDARAADTRAGRRLARLSSDRSSSRHG